MQLFPDRSVLVLVDLQPKFMAAIHEADRVLNRSLFLAKVAHLLEIPILGTVQNQARMGGLDDAFQALCPHSFDKMTFSCTEDAGFFTALEALERSQVVLVGVETHICVSLTAHGLLAAGYKVVVCPDAVSSRTQDRHKLGMERIRDAGVTPAHTESVAYEWFRDASRSDFKPFLEIVKAHP
jgi:nicotinamidase-related amidase